MSTSSFTSRSNNNHRNVDDNNDPVNDPIAVGDTNINNHGWRRYPQQPPLVVHNQHQQQFPPHPQRVRSDSSGSTCNALYPPPPSDHSSSRQLVVNEQKQPTQQPNDMTWRWNSNTTTSHPDPGGWWWNQQHHHHNHHLPHGGYHPYGSSTHRETTNSMTDTMFQQPPPPLHDNNSNSNLQQHSMYYGPMAHHYYGSGNPTVGWSMMDHSRPPPSTDSMHHHHHPTMLLQQQQNDTTEAAQSGGVPSYGSTTTSALFPLYHEDTQTMQQQQTDEIHRFAAMAQQWSETPMSYANNNNTSPSNKKNNNNNNHDDDAGRTPTDTSTFFADNNNEPLVVAPKQRGRSGDEEEEAMSGRATPHNNDIAASSAAVQWSVVDDNTSSHTSTATTLVVARFVHKFLYNPMSPEFTSLQQFNWAVLLGIFMGFFTAYWKAYIDAGVTFIWITVPQTLLSLGIFETTTSNHGYVPLLYHYMWIVPAVMGGTLSYLFAVLKCPDQNEWIHSLHTRGIQDHKMFFYLFFLSTAGIWSGMSLGPELPLVLLGGMVGSALALLCRQSILQARVMNLTAASAAVSGFFGFPMAGALFVLEIPHRMGLQYFEALSPATISSIVAVLANRLVTGNDVTGYYRYPWLETTLPSSIFTYAIVYGVYGCVIGTLYVYGVKRCKSMVHHAFHSGCTGAAAHPSAKPMQASDAPASDHTLPSGDQEEVKPLLPTADNASSKQSQQQQRLGNAVVAGMDSSQGRRLWFRSYGISHGPTRAACAGAIAGGLCGVIGIFLPHTMFWGEAQLQTLIDKGRTPLPVFSSIHELTPYAQCIIDPNDEAAIRAGFGIRCSAIIAVAKIVTIGLSLGTGIIGGQFWGPMFVGCAASHLLTDMIYVFHSYFGFGRGLAMHPCVVILCTMGAAHVVTFRAHLAIMLILTLTISAFNPEAVGSNSSAAGDYSAVFPLLVVAVFVSLMVSRDTVVYAEQRCRGDITAVPEVLCRPGMEGTPLVVDYEHDLCDNTHEGDSDSELPVPTVAIAAVDTTSATNVATTDSELAEAASRLEELLGISVTAEPEKEAPVERRHSANAVHRSQMTPPRRRSHVKDPVSVDSDSKNHGGNSDSFSSTESQKGQQLVRVASFGDIQEHQPSLLQQARLWSASTVGEATKHRRVPSLPNAPRASTQHKRASSLTTPPRPSGSQVTNLL